MQTSFETIESEALKLNVSERAKLADHFIASLDEDSEIEEAWVAEVSRRIAEIDAGTVQLIPVNEAIASVRKQMRCNSNNSSVTPAKAGAQLNQ